MWSSTIRGGHGEAIREFRFAAQDGESTCFDQFFDRDLSACFEPPASELHRVATTACPVEHQTVGEDPEQLSFPEHGEARPDDFAVHRMTQRDERASLITADLDEPSLLEPEQHRAASHFRGVGHLLDVGESCLSRDGQHLEHRRRLGVEFRELRGDQLLERRGCRHLAEAPQLVPFEQGSLIEREVDEFAQDLEVAVRRNRQPFGSASVDRPVESPMEQRRDFVVGQRRQWHQDHVLVLQQ